MKLEGKILKFIKRTDDWVAVNKGAGYEVGVIVHYPLWESWVFQPHPTNVFSLDQIDDIKSFMEQLK